MLDDKPGVAIYAIDAKEALNDQRWNHAVRVIGFAQGSRQPNK